MLLEKCRHSLETLIAHAEQKITVRIEPYSEMVPRRRTIPGVHRVVACAIAAELRPDMTVFPDAGSRSHAPGNPNSSKTAGPLDP